MQLYRSIEQPQRYTLVVDWETVENHMVDFRESTDFRNGASSWQASSSSRHRCITSRKSCSVQSASGGSSYLRALPRKRSAGYFSAFLAILAETAPAMSMSS